MERNNTFTPNSDPTEVEEVHELDAQMSKWSRLHTFLTDAALLNMTAQEKKKYYFNQSMTEYLGEINEERNRRNPFSFKNTVRTALRGDVAVVESASGVIFKGR